MHQVDSHVQSTSTTPVVSVMTAFEQAQIHVQKLKAWLTAGSIMASVLAAILAYSSAQKVQNLQATDAFQLKAAEIVMASRNAWEAEGKARALYVFFPDKVPKSFLPDKGAGEPPKFDPYKFAWGRESRRELLHLLTEPPTTPESRAVVLKTWKALWPSDEFVNDELFKVESSRDVGRVPK